MATHTTNAIGFCSQVVAATVFVASSRLGVLSADMLTAMANLWQPHTGTDLGNRRHQCQTIVDLQLTAAFFSLVRLFFWLEKARALCTSIHPLSLE